MTEFISKPWGISPNSYVNGFQRRVCTVLFGDEEQVAVSGVYPNRRRAKKEITHYINRGLDRPFHGASKYLKSITKK
jgi:hypothetical protein